MQSIIRQLEISDEDKEQTIDLRPFMDPSPYVVNDLMPVRRVYRLFNEMGVRHLPVVDGREQVVGIITRKDILPEIMHQRVAQYAGRSIPVKDGQKRKKFTMGEKVGEKAMANAAKYKTRCPRPILLHLGCACQTLKSCIILRYPLIRHALTACAAKLGANLSRKDLCRHSKRENSSSTKESTENSDTGCQV